MIFNALGPVGGGGRFRKRVLVRVCIFADSAKLDKTPGIVVCLGIGGSFGNSGRVCLDCCCQLDV